MQLNSEPIKHHYIPQFILKNFCFDDRCHIYYFDKLLNQISVKETRSIFMMRNLYRDDTGNAEDPVKTEKDLARFENEVSQIINKRFLQEDKIVLNVSENEKLLLFFALMGIRSKLTSQTFGESLTNKSKALYKQYQHNGNFSELWKRNLGQLANCRSLKEVFDNPLIDEPFKIFMHRDAFGYFGIHMSVVENTTDSEFVIGDAYPVVITGEALNGLMIQMYTIFTISPNRAILCVFNGVEEVSRDVSVFRECIFNHPVCDSENNLLAFRVRKLYNKEIDFINSVIVKEAHEGIAFRLYSNPKCLPHEGHLCERNND